MESAIDEYCQGTTEMNLHTTFFSEIVLLGRLSLFTIHVRRMAKSSMFSPSVEFDDGVLLAERRCFGLTSMCHAEVHGLEGVPCFLGYERRHHFRLKNAEDHLEGEPVVVADGGAGPDRLLELPTFDHHLQHQEGLIPVVPTGEHRPGRASLALPDPPNQ